jgi:hypothetical protein
VEESDGPDGQKNHQEKNHLEEFEAYLRTLPPVYGRRLTFAERCGLAFALRKGARAAHVAEAFALSRATVSWLAHCLQPGQKHYRDVWEEYQRLGGEAFQKLYFLPHIVYRLKRVELSLTHLTDGQDIAPKAFGPDPRADKYAYANVGLIEIPDNTRWRIDWIGDGWRIACPEQGVVWGLDRVDGATDNPRPFRTSAEAFDGIYTLNGYENPRPKPGRRA